MSPFVLYAARIFPIAFILPLPGGIAHRRLAWVIERCALTCALTLLVANFVRAPLAQATASVLAGEVLKGALFGLVAAAFVYAAMAAGTLALAQLRVQHHAATTPLPLAYSLFAWLLFALLDGPRHLLLGLAKTYVQTPVGERAPASTSLAMIADVAGKLFATAAELAAPLFAALLLADIVVLLTERLAPSLRALPLHVPVRWLIVATAICLLPLYGLHVLGPLELAHPERLWERAATRWHAAPR